ncbi:hypothetical protein Trydic_g9214 [Trypoxylus dichotomus]
MQKLLDDPNYKPIISDPINRTKINNLPLSEEAKKSIIPSEKSSKCPVSKTHSEQDRITDSSPCSVHGKPTKAIRRTDDLLRRGCGHVDSRDMLVSFDVASLFTQVPINEIAYIIRNKHQVGDHLINLMEHFLKNTNFTYNG